MHNQIAVAMRVERLMRPQTHMLRLNSPKKQWLFLLFVVLVIVGAPAIFKYWLYADACKVAIAEFHSLIGEERYLDIYHNASEKFRQQYKEDQAVALFLNTKQLGRVTETHINKWGFGSGTLPEVQLISETTFRDDFKGRRFCRESFSFEVKDGKAYLLNYMLKIEN